MQLENVSIFDWNMLRFYRLNIHMLSLMRVLKTTVIFKNTTKWLPIITSTCLELSWIVISLAIIPHLFVFFILYMLETNCMCHWVVVKKHSFNWINKKKNTWILLYFQNIKIKTIWLLIVCRYRFTKIII